ncbi:MAG: leucine-rich repeat domain-containing protein, partial [Candidatus Heimdallarchaeota archaeon]|nr:leucine-rich repeat domain-containing protein [Candidatus Heimdallarchaeota archaeon]MCK5049399.1 leucine-rich repeat domain-containing protein [Candidatus Heimdallarchaeota archaeon]
FEKIEIDKTNSLLENMKYLLDEINYNGLKILSIELGKEMINWPREEIFGINADLEKGKTQRIAIRKKQVTALNLNDLDISYFPIAVNSDNFPNLKALNFARNDLFSVNISSIQSLIHLERLILSENQLNWIDLSPVTRLENLKWLEVWGNKLEEVDLEALSYLKNLEFLYLNNNEIREIDLSPLLKLDNLKGIWLENNQLSYETIEQLKSIIEKGVSVKF